jgi:hypothetical protein
MLTQVRFDLEEEIYKKIKIKAIKDNKKIKVLLSEIIKDYLKKDE